MGLLEDEDDYTFFKFPRNGKLMKLLKYDKADYADYGHFFGGITRFISSTFFLKDAVALESLTIEELDKIHQRVSSS
jgi:hypothetical protein